MHTKPGKWRHATWSTPRHTHVHVNMTYVWMCIHNLENGAVTMQAIDNIRTHMYIQYQCVSICISKTWKMAWRRLEYSAAAFLSSFASVRSDVMSSSRRASASALRLPTTKGKKRKKVVYLLHAIIIKLTFEMSRARHGAHLYLGLRPPPTHSPKTTKKVSSIYSEITTELTFEKSQTREVVPPPLPCGSLPMREGKIVFVMHVLRIDSLRSKLVLKTDEKWGAGVETQKNVLGEIGGWGRVPFNETYAPSLSTIYDGA